MIEEREPVEGERCCCGELAVTVFVTALFGDVAYCGSPTPMPAELAAKMLGRPPHHAGASQ